MMRKRRQARAGVGSAEDVKNERERLLNLMNEQADKWGSNNKIFRPDTLKENQWVVTPLKRCVLKVLPANDSGAKPDYDNAVELGFEEVGKWPIDKKAARKLLGENLFAFNLVGPMARVNAIDYSPIEEWDEISFKVPWWRMEQLTKCAVDDGANVAIWKDYVEKQPKDRNKRPSKDFTLLMVNESIIKSIVDKCKITFGSDIPF